MEIPKYTLPDWVTEMRPPPEWYDGKIKIGNQEYSSHYSLGDSQLDHTNCTVTYYEKIEREWYQISKEWKGLGERLTESQEQTRVDPRREGWPLAHTPYITWNMTVSGPYLSDNDDILGEGGSFLKLIYNTQDHEMEVKLKRDLFGETTLRVMDPRNVTVSDDDVLELQIWGALNPEWLSQLARLKLALAKGLYDYDIPLEVMQLIGSKIEDVVGDESLQSDEEAEPELQAAEEATTLAGTGASLLDQMPSSLRSSFSFSGGGKKRRKSTKRQISTKRRKSKRRKSKRRKSTKRRKYTKRRKSHKK